jgi:hypothetical protein
MIYNFVLNIYILFYIFKYFKSDSVKVHPHFNLKLIPLNLYPHQANKVMLNKIRMVLPKLRLIFILLLF